MQFISGAETKHDIKLKYLYMRQNHQLTTAAKRLFHHQRYENILQREDPSLHLSLLIIESKIWRESKKLLMTQGILTNRL